MMTDTQCTLDQSPPGRNDLLLAAFDASEDAILVTDLSDIVRTWNHGAEMLYGYREAEVVGRSAILLLPPGRVDEGDDISRRIQSGERVSNFETTRLRKDGTVVNVSLTVSPVSLARRIVGTSHISRKIAQRAVMNAATAQLAAIVDYSEDAIVSKNLEGIVLTWNAAAERLYGYSAEEILWRPSSLLLPSDRPNEETEMLERLKRGERVDCIETVRVRKDGTAIDVSLTISPIRDSDGHIRGASHIARNISDRLAFQAHLLQTQKLESIGILAGGIAHDFNNLLTCIMGGVSFATISLSPDHPTYPSLLLAEQACEKAADLTHQLLAYAGHGKFAVTRFDLTVLIQDMLKLLQTSIPKSVELKLALEHDLPWIEADASQIEQIVMNLVINGAEAIGAEGGSLWVSTGAAPADGRVKNISGVDVCLEVRDSGSGMTQATKARIFDPFFTTKVTGRGLGLAAVAGIVRKHKGKMEVESSIGEGTTFRLSFPGVVKRAPRRRKTALLIGAQVVGTVLVVDDEPALRTLARAILQQCGYKVLVAEDGQQAVEVFQQHAETITAILLDLTMPLMSGEEAFRLIRGIRADIPIVVATGYSETATRELFGAATLIEFIQKPYTFAQLGEKIRDIGKGPRSLVGRAAG